MKCLFLLKKYLPLFVVRLRVCVCVRARARARARACMCVCVCVVANRLIYIQRSLDGRMC